MGRPKLLFSWLCFRVLRFSVCSLSCHFHLFLCLAMWSRLTSPQPLKWLAHRSLPFHPSVLQPSKSTFFLFFSALYPMWPCPQTLFVYASGSEHLLLKRWTLPQWSFQACSEVTEIHPGPRLLFVACLPFWCCGILMYSASPSHHIFGQYSSIFLGGFEMTSV